MTASLDRAVEAACEAHKHALNRGYSHEKAVRRSVIAALPHLGVDREALLQRCVLPVEKWRLHCTAQKIRSMDDPERLAVLDRNIAEATEILHLIETNQESDNG